MPRRRPGAHLVHGRLHVAAEEPGPHSCRGHPVLRAGPFEEPSAEPAGGRPRRPRHGQVHDVDRVPLADQHVSVVEVDEGDPAGVQLVKDAVEPVEAALGQRAAGKLGQRSGVEPLGGQPERSGPTQESGDSGQPLGGVVGRDLPPDEEPAQRLADEPRPRGVVLDGDAEPRQFVEQEVGLGSVSPGPPLERPRVAQSPRPDDRRRAACATLFRGVDLVTPLF